MINQSNTHKINNKENAQTHNYKACIAHHMNQEQSDCIAKLYIHLSQIRDQLVTLIQKIEQTKTSINQKR